jgi:hypothetical protein
VNYAVFSADGQPLRAGICPPTKVEQQAREGETVVEWNRDLGSPANWLLVDGELVER